MRAYVLTSSYWKYNINIKLLDTTITKEQKHLQMVS